MRISLFCVLRICYPEPNIPHTVMFISYSCPSFSQFAVWLFNFFLWVDRILVTCSSFVIFEWLRSALYFSLSRFIFVHISFFVFILGSGNRVPENRRNWTDTSIMLVQIILSSHSVKIFWGKKFIMVKEEKLLWVIVYRHLWYIACWIIDFVNKLWQVANICLLSWSQDSAAGSGTPPICWQAQTKLEVHLYMFLWSPDTEAVLVAMSCFRHLCEEADIRWGGWSVSTQLLAQL